MSRLRDASTEAPPLPSRELMLRVGLLPTDDLATAYVTLGRAVAEDLVELMPPGWTLEGRRVLDFGCGAGRVLRHFAESGDTVFAGCDVDAASIDWLRGNMPWVDAFVVGEAPPAPRPDGAYDVIWAASVFTHLTDHWAAWLLDLHRLLSDGGLLIASFLGPAMSPSIAGEPLGPRPDRHESSPLRRELESVRPPFPLVDPRPLGQSIRRRGATSRAASARPPTDPKGTASSCSAASPSR